MDINLGLSAIATGTVDAITATYSPAPTLVDKKILFLRTIGTNTITNPTFSPNGLTVRTITKNGGDALLVGDLDGDVILMYDSTNTRWELLNPKVSIGATHSLAQVLAAGNKTGGLTITSDDATKVLEVLNAVASLGVSDGTGALDKLTLMLGSAQLRHRSPTKNSEFKADDTQALISHPDLITLDALNVNLPFESPDKIAIIDGSRNVKSGGISEGDIATTTYADTKIPKSLATAVNDFIVASGAGAFVKKTLAETKTILGLVFGTTAGTYAEGNDARFVEPKTVKSLFSINATLSHTGSTIETIMYNSSPNLKNLFQANDSWFFEVMIQATNSTGTKDVRFYISDSQTSLLNQVLIGRMTATTSAATNQHIPKAMWFRGAVNSQIVTQNASGGFSQTAQVATSIDFTTDKYLIITGHLNTGTETLSILQGWSIIHRP